MSHRSWLVLGAIVLLALVLRLAVVAATSGFVPRTDAADYDREAVTLSSAGHLPGSLLAPGGPSAFPPPAFPIALALAYRVAGTTDPHARWRAGRILEAGLGALSCGLTGLIALELFGSGTALLAAGLSAVYPPLALSGSSLMSETLFVPAVLAGMLCALWARRRHARAAAGWSLVAGLCIGVAALTRSNGLALALPVVLLVWHRRPWRSRKSLALPALSVLGLLLVLTPWTVRNAAQFGELVPASTESGFALAGTYNAVAQARRDFPALWVPPVQQLAAELRRHPGVNEAALSDALDRDGLRYIVDHPVSLLRTMGWNTLRMLDLTGTRYERWAGQYVDYSPWLVDASVYATWALILAVALLVTLAARRATLRPVLRRVPGPMWLWPVLVVLTGIPFIGATRYRVPADPFVLALLGALLASVLPATRGGHVIQGDPSLPSAPA